MSTPHTLSLTTALEKLVAREDESIAMLEEMLMDLGDTVASSLLHQLISQKEYHRKMITETLEEIQDQFILDEAVI